MPRPMPRVPPVTSAVLLVIRAKERQVRSALGESLDVESGLAQVVVAPHARLAVRNTRAGGHVIPPVRPVIDGMQQQPLMTILGAKVRLLKQRSEHAESRLVVASGAAGITPLRQDAPQPQQTLRGNGGCRTVHRLVVVER